MRRVRRYVAVLFVVALASVTAACALLLGGPRYQPIAATGPFDGTVAIFMSGDAGLRFGMGRPVTRALAARGIPVLGISSPSAFRDTRTRADVDRVLADGIRRALATPGVKRLVLIGQSFGADMLATMAPDLPPDLRPRIAGVMMVVPARTVYFHADPLGLAYRRPPDAMPAPGMARLDWAPVLCVQGAAEEDSLCPLLSGPRVTRVVLPGGHFLNHDDAALIATIMARLDALGL